MAERDLKKDALFIKLMGGHAKFRELQQLWDSSIPRGEYMRRDIFRKRAQMQGYTASQIDAFIGY